MKDFDAIIIGSGLGGLSAATALSVAGKRVLVVERHNVPGGYATSFLRGRFEFDASLHELSGVGTPENRGPLWGLLESYGMTSKVAFVPIPDFYRCMFPGLDITLPAGRRNFEELLCSEFPGDAEGIKDFSAIIFDFAREAFSVELSGKKPGELDPSEFPTVMKYGNRTVADVLYPAVANKKARMVLSMLCNYLGQIPSRGGFAPYAMGVSTFLNFGPVHIKGKSQALSQAFADTIEENGGEVWLNNGAAGIITSEGRVRGVVTEDGTRLNSPHVICNVNPFVACLELIGKDRVPDWYLKRLGAWSPGVGTFNVFLGLNRPYSYFGLSSHETFAGFDYYDWDGEDQKMRTKAVFSPSGLGITAYNVADESFSPPGTTAVAITFGAYGEPWRKLTPTEYVEAKDRMAEKVVAAAETLAPGLRNHIEVMEVATPLTNLHYSGNPGGSFAGYAEGRQPSRLTRLPSHGPLEGLFFASAWVGMGGGFLPSILGGRFAANAVLEDMGQGGRAPGLMNRMQRQMEKEVSLSGSTKDAETLLPKGGVSRMHTVHIPLKVEKIIQETPTTKTLRLVSPEGRLPAFRAGQYINLFVEIDGILTSRPYTLSSSPSDPWYDITIRKKENGFVSCFLLNNARPGHTFQSTLPNGNFYHNPVTDSRDLVFLAGGSGITPFISILRDVTEKHLPLKIHLIYGSRLPSDTIFKQELETLASEHENIRVDFVVSEAPDTWAGPRGLLDETMISSLVGPVAGRSFFMCGPSQMLELCGGALRNLGTDERRIRQEAGGPPEDVTRVPGWPGVSADETFEVLEEKSGRSFRAKSSEPLLTSLERAGIVAPALCRSGECGACRTRLVAGKVFVPDTVHVRQSDREAGYVHACMSYPLEDLRIRL